MTKIRSSILPKTYDIQRFILSGDCAPSELYVRISSDRSENKSSTFDLTNLEVGQKCSFNTYFNALYLSYWNNNTDITRIGIALNLMGQANITVKHQVGTTVETLGVYEIAAPQSFQASCLWLDGLTKDLVESRSRGRIFIELTAITETYLEQISFVTDMPPQRSVTLSIGLCTFNKENFIARTLNSIDQIKMKRTEIGKIYIVNHGAEFSGPDFLSALEARDVVTIHQPNLGGCGGFNRTMIEAVESDEAATHHLVMDDDIELDPNIIGRSIDFLSHANHHIALGGHMLESDNKTILHEAGAILDPFWFVISKLKYTDVSETENLQAFDEAYPIDFNAWWFCIIPRKAIGKIGYSPPIFIHGDDIEYGLRLKSNTVETISPPGIAVWHESFAAKNKDWIQYYDLRNRLIIAISHPEKCSPPNLLYLFGLVTVSLVTHRYQAAEMQLKAISDFLSGPQKLFSRSADELHTEVTTFEQILETSQLCIDINVDSLASVKPYAHDPSIGKFAKDIFISAIMILFLPTSTKVQQLHTRETLFPSLVKNQPIYILENLERSVFRIYKPNRWLLITGLIKALKTTFQFGLKRRIATKNWQNNIANFQTADFWKKQFGSDEIRPARDN